MTELILERRDQPDRTRRLTDGDVAISLTPPIDEDYWSYRVRVADGQAIVAFPKFMTIGIGFAKEDGMSRYAEATQVPSERSKAEIETTLRRYGATAFASGWDEKSATVVFQIADRHVRFYLPLPSPHDAQFATTETGRPRRSDSAREAAYEQAVRQSWRALALVIKAKLEAVAAGITTVEEEFLAHIVLPDGSTFGQWAAPQLERAYTNHQMPALLPGGAS